MARNRRAARKPEAGDEAVRPEKQSVKEDGPDGPAQGQSPMRLVVLVFGIPLALLIAGGVLMSRC